MKSYEDVKKEAVAQNSSGNNNAKGNRPSYEELKKEVSGYSADEKKRVVTEFDSRTSDWNVASLRYSPVDNDYINSFISDANSYVTNFNDKYGDLDYATVMSDSFLGDADGLKSTEQNLRSRARLIQEYLYANKEQFDDETYTSLTSFLNSFNSANGSRQLSSARDYYSQWETQEDYDKSVREYGYYQKYEGMTDAELATAIGKLDDGEEKDWATAYQGNREYETMVNLDNEKYERQTQYTRDYIDKWSGLEWWYNEYQVNPGNAAYGMTDAEVEERLAMYNEIVSRYGSVGNMVDTLSGTVQEREKYLTRAKRAQEGYRLGAVGTEGSEYYDPNFDQYTGYVSTKYDEGFSWNNITSQYGMGYADLTYEYINGDAEMRKDILGKSIIFDGAATSSSVETWASYNYMTGHEIDTYNYYYATGGKEAADAYLDSIREQLNYRVAEKRFASMEGKTGLELLFGIEAGLDQFESGIRNVFNTTDDYIPYSSTQMVSGMVREDLADDSIPIWYNFKTGKWEDKVFGSSLGQMGYDTITTTANMAPSILVSTAIGIVNPAAGAAVGSTLMGASAAGNAYQEKLNLGYTKEQARAYSTMVGASEAILQYALGGIEKLGGNGLKAVFKGLDTVDNVFDVFAKTVGGRILYKGASEAFEEGLQSILEPYFLSIVSGTPFTADMEEALYSALLGFVTGGVFEGIDVVKESTVNTRNQRVQNTATGRAIMAADGGVDALMNLANEVAGVSTGKLKKSLTKQTGKVSNKIEAGSTSKSTARKVGELYETVGTAATAQNQADIAKSLERKGFTTKVANSIAEAIVAQANGQELTNEQRRLLESARDDPDIQAAINDIVKNEKSTMGQRNQKLSEVATAVVQSGTVETATGATTGSAKAEASSAAVREDKAGVAETEAEDYTVSSDGKAINTETGKTVELKGFVVSGGKLAIVTDSGTVSRENISYANENQAALYETVLNLGITDADYANFLLKEWQESPGGVSAADYVNGIRDAFAYGQHNLPIDELSQTETTSKLTREQRNTAYYVGQKFAGKQTATAESVARQNRLKARMAKSEASQAAQAKKTDTGKNIPNAKEKADTGKVSAKKGGVYYGYDGKTMDQRTGKKLSKQQRVGVDFAERLAASRGMTIYFYESFLKDGKRVYKDASGKIVEADNGFYDPETGAIHIDLNAGEYGQGTVLFTIAHELTHFIKDSSPAQYKKLSSLLMKGYKAKGQSVRELVDAQQAKAKRRGEELSFDEAYDEVIADSMESILADGRVMELMGDIEAADKGLLATVKKFFRDIAKLIKQTIDAYKDVKPETPEGRMVQQMEDIYGQLQEIFVKGVYVGAENAAEGVENSREIAYSKRGHQKQFFKENVFPPYNESQSQAHELAERWSRSESTQSGERKLISFHNKWYLIEAFDDLKYGYQIMKALAKREYLREAQHYGIIVGATAGYKSIQGALSEDAARNYRRGSNGNAGHRFDNDAFEHRGENRTVYGLGEEQIQRGESERNSTRDLQGSGLDSQGTNGSSVTDTKIKRSARERANETVGELLQKENEKLKADVEQLKEMLKLQRTVTNGTKFTKTSVEAAARWLKQEAGSRGDTKEIVALLNVLYEHIAGGKELTWESVKEAAQPAVDWLMEHVQLKSQRSEYANDILQELRTSRIYLDETQAQEAAHRYGSYNEFRKAAMGSVILAKENSVSLDSKWQELAEMYPDVFDADMNAADMPEALLEIVGSLRNSDTSLLEYEYNRDMIAQDLLRQVYDSYWRVSTLKTFADVKQKQIDRLKGEHANRMEKLREDSRTKIDQMKADHRAEIKQLRQEHTAELENQRKEIVKRYEASRKKAVEGHQKTELRRKVRKKIRDLDKLLNRGTRERNVKTGMKDLVAYTIASAEILFTDNVSDEDLIRGGIGTDLTEAESELLNQTVDLMAQVSELSGYENLEKRDKLERRLKQNIRQLRDVLARERARLNKATVGGILSNLAESYHKLKDSKDAFLQGTYQENVYSYLTQLQEDIGGTIVRDMTADQLAELDKAYSMVLTAVRNANKLFRQGRAEEAHVRINRVQSEIRKIASSEKDPDARTEEIADWLRSFSWNELRPVDAFNRLGSEAFTELFWDVIEAQGEYGAMAEEIRDKLVNARKSHNYSKWDMQTAETFDTVDGKQFRLTLEDKMSIYAYSRREQAQDHMTDGGFVFDTGSTYREKRGGKRFVHKKLTSPYRISNGDIQAIIESLTEEQTAYVDEIQSLMTEFGRRGNSVSQTLYGIDIFTEDVYFPLMSEKDYRNSTSEALNNTQTMVSLKNTGMTKQTVPHADNPIVLRAFDDVVLEHLDKMSKYIAYVLPIENIQKVYNSVGRDAADGDSYVSTQALIGSKFGKSAQNYFEQYIKDLNGNPAATGAKSPIAGWFAKSKAAAVAANLSVVIQQYSAVIRAMNEIDPQYMIPFLNGNASKTDGKIYEELRKYAPVAVIKDMGGFDVGSNRGMKDYIGLEETAISGAKLWKGMQDIFGWGAQQMDKVGWSTIWRAVKKETAAKTDLKVGSEEFLRACGKRFTEVVTKTQVYDSVNSRSGFMRSSSDAVKYLTTYMGEPTVVVGMVFSAHLELARAIKSRNKSRIAKAVGANARTAGVLLAATVVNGLLKSLVYAMRDDDEDEAFLERWAKQFGDGLVSDMNFFSLLPVTRDIVSLLDGWDVERPDMTLIAELIESTKDVIVVWADEEKREEMTSGDWYDLAKNFVGDLGNMFGVPARNIVRDTEGVIRFFGDLTDNIYPTDVGGAFVRGVTGEEQTKSEAICKALLSGDEGRIEVLRAGYADEKAWNIAVRMAVREAYDSGEIDEETAVYHLVKNGGWGGETAVEKVNYWAFQQEWPEYEELTEGDVAKYYEFAEPAGIELDVYAEYCDRVSGGMKKAEVLAVIHDLDLTKKQKDALYFACGYAESTLDEAPWH